MKNSDFQFKFVISGSFGEILEKASEVGGRLAEIGPRLAEIWPEVGGDLLEIILTVVL